MALIGDCGHYKTQPQQYGGSSESCSKQGISSQCYLTYRRNILILSYSLVFEFLLHVIVFQLVFFSFLIARVIHVRFVISIVSSVNNFIYIRGFFSVHVLSINLNVQCTSNTYINLPVNPTVYLIYVGLTCKSIRTATPVPVSDVGRAPVYLQLVDFSVH